MVRDLRPWLKPLGLIYSEVMRGRNWLYNQGWLKTEWLPCPVISVGNLTAGGTGKTPLVMWLVEELKRRGLKPAVISRGYGREGEGVEQVNPNLPDAARRFGDEPTQMALKLKSVPVWVGADRVKAGRFALNSSEGVNVLVADDAFQHRHLGRNLNLLVCDASQSPSALNPLPWGLGRENKDEMKRAQLVVLTKVNFAKAERIQEWKSILSAVNLAEVAYRPQKICSLMEGQRLSPDGEWFAVAGIGRPETFLSLVKDELKLNLLGYEWFRDHHQYSRKDLDRLEKSIPKAARLIITEKDAAKWRIITHPLLKRTAFVELGLEWKAGKGLLDHAVDALAH